MKIVKLKFQISDYTGTKEAGIGNWKKDHSKNQENLFSPSDIEEDVNNTLRLLEASGNKVIDVRTDFVTVQRHNNAGCDTVFEHVTILYT